MAVSIVDLNRAGVLCALYNASHPLGMGFLQYDPKPMQREEAEGLLEQQQDFDYLKGRVMKLSLRNHKEFDEWGYDRDNGAGAAQRAIDALRSGDTSHAARAHESGTVAAANEVKGHLRTPTKFANGVVTLGLADVADKLAPKVDAALAGQTSKRN